MPYIENALGIDVSSNHLQKTAKKRVQTGQTTEKRPEMVPQFKLHPFVYNHLFNHGGLTVMKKHRKSFVPQFGLCLMIALLASCGKDDENKEEQKAEGTAAQAQEKATAKAPAPGQEEFDAGVELFNAAKELYRNGHSLLNAQEYSEGSEMLEEAAELFAAAGIQFSDAAELGNTEAIYYIGMCLDYGNYTSDTAEDALDFYKKAADAGIPDAQYIMGKIYLTGRGYARELVNKLTGMDPEKGMEWWGKAAAQGHAESLYQIALRHSNSEDMKSIPLKEVYENFRKAAEKGHAKAQYCLGLCYYNGWGVEKDLEQAAKWFKAASDRGELNAKNRLGECYYSGEGVSKDQKKAFELFKAAADEKNGEAMCNLGICYVEGAGTTKDVSKGMLTLCAQLRLRTGGIGHEKKEPEDS